MQQSLLIKQLRAINNDTKFEILKLLTNEGAKSITDIAKKLKLNFSTAHKYLELLEDAELIESREVSDNRLKRLFNVKAFNIEVNPSSLAGDKKQETSDAVKILTDSSEEEYLDEDKFIEEYVSHGMSPIIAKSNLEQIKQNTFPGKTILEIREEFEQAAYDKINNLTSALYGVKKSVNRSSYSEKLKNAIPQIIKLHKNGDVFIKNLSHTQLLDFVHDVRGISVHGIEGKDVKNIKQILSYLSVMIKLVSTISRKQQGIDSFNYLLAPSIKDEKDYKLIKDYVSELEQISKELNINMYLAIDIGVPRFAKKVTTDYFYMPSKNEKVKGYEDYQQEANKITSEVLDSFRNKKFENLHLIIKLWDNTKLDLDGIDHFSIANLNPNWQGANASYISNKIRFGSTWKGWMRSVRSGEVQKITINFPRLALESKTTKEFKEKLSNLIKIIIDAFGYIGEANLGEFLRSNKTVLPSNKKKKWTYITVEDSLYSIAVLGLKETIQILKQKNKHLEKQKDSKVAKDILVYCNQLISEGTLSLRVNLKEEAHQEVSERLFYLDNKKHKVPFKKYTLGAKLDTDSDTVSLHKYLLAGHGLMVPRNKIEAFAKKNKDFGLIYC